MAFQAGYIVGFRWTRVLPRSKKWRRENKILRSHKQEIRGTWQLSTVMIAFYKDRVALAINTIWMLPTFKISFSPVTKASFILIAQNGGSARGGRTPKSYELKAILKKGAMVTNSKVTCSQRGTNTVLPWWHLSYNDMLNTHTATVQNHSHGHVYVPYSPAAIQPTHIYAVR